MEVLSGRYELQDRIGHGGMATVFSAHDAKLGRQVAVKLLADNLAGDDEFRRRFSREARLAAKLDHNNVVKVFDVGEEERPYIVMEFVDGQTLAQRLERRRGVKRETALQLLGQTSAGLAHAHDRGLVHRDVKPQNLLIRGGDGCVKIADFGIARTLEDATRLTQTGKVVGTDRYMAPEQLSDDEITPAVDVYAFGVVADELLPERRPAEVRDLIGRCLSSDPRDRYGNGAELSAALERIDGTAPTAPTALRPRKAESGTATRRVAATSRTAATRRATKSGSSRRPKILALLGIAAIVVAIVIAAGSGGSSPQKAQSSGSGSGAVIPQSGDSADQARALASYFREQAR